jgi:anti-sigma factor RsiW
VKCECDNLDAYLVEELSPEAASQFLQHLDACDECRHAVDEQNWIDGLLRSDVCRSHETAPVSLIESIRDATMVHRRRSAFLVAGSFAAVAAAILVAAGWTLALSRQATKVAATDPAAATDTITQPAVSPGVVRTKAVFVGTGEAIAVPIESSDDNVTVVQLYPTTDTERRLRRELAFQSFESDANGG